MPVKEKLVGDITIGIQGSDYVCVLHPSDTDADDKRAIVMARINMRMVPDEAAFHAWKDQMSKWALGALNRFGKETGIEPSFRLSGFEPVKSGTN